MNIRSFALGLLFALAACATTAAPPAQPDFYVMRHLHTPAGVTDPDLTSEGVSHAGAVSDWFRKDPPNAIYVSSAKRARQTAEPLARRLKLTPKIYDPRDTPALLALVKQESGTVLIVGHSNTVPDIIEGLGGKRPAPLVHEDFGDIWHIAGPDRNTTHVRIRM